MMIPSNKRRYALLAVLTVLLFIVTLAVFQFSASTKTYARGNAPVSVQRHGLPLWPQVRSTPESAGAGSYFYLSGTGFLANEQMTVDWQTPRRTISLGLATADASGGLFYAGFYVPMGLAPDRYNIALQRANGLLPKTLSVPFRVMAPAMQISRVANAENDNSQLVLLHLSNFATYETLTISWNAHGGGSQQLGHVATHYNGEGYFSFVPPAATKGTYIVTVKGQQSGLTVSGQVTL